MEAVYTIIGASATLVVAFAVTVLKRRFAQQDSKDAARKKQDGENDAAQSKLEIFNTGKLFGRVEKLEADIERLRTIIMSLTTKNVELSFENKQLKAESQQLKEENQQLRDDNAELHEKIEKLEMQVQQLIDQAGQE